MITVELKYDGSAGRLRLRDRHRQHIGQLHAEGELLAAGPWADGSGALLIFTGDYDRVQQVLREDPYYSAPGVTVLAIRQWTPIVGGPPPKVPGEEAH